MLNPADPRSPLWVVANTPSPDIGTTVSLGDVLLGVGLVILVVGIIRLLDRH